MVVVLIIDPLALARGLSMTKSGGYIANSNSYRVKRSINYNIKRHIKGRSNLS
jgi:hypothetical protein